MDKHLEERMRNLETLAALSAIVFWFGAVLMLYYFFGGFGFALGVAGGGLLALFSVCRECMRVSKEIERIKKGDD